jgi:hypothetical protein
VLLLLLLLLYLQAIDVLALMLDPSYVLDHSLT